MKRRCAVYLTATLLVLAGFAAAEVRYISDELRVPLRAGPSGEHRILHWGLPSGMTLEVLSEDEAAGFTEVRTETGMTGWLPRQYLVSEPVAAARLEEANAEIGRLSALLEGGESAVATELAHVREVEELNIELQRRYEALQAEFAEFRSVFESEINVHAENQRLADENDGLRGEVDDLADAAARLQVNVERQWMLIGAGLVLLGFLIGFAVKSRPRRSAWS